MKPKNVPAWKTKVVIAETMLNAKNTDKTKTALAERHGLSEGQVQSIGAQRLIHIRVAIAQILEIIEDEGKGKKRDPKKIRADKLLGENNVHGAVETYADASATEELIAVAQAFNTTDYTIAAMAYEYAQFVEGLLVLADRLEKKEKDPVTAQKVRDRALRISKQAFK